MIERRVMSGRRIVRSVQALLAHGLLFLFTILLADFSPLWLFHLVVARGRFSVPAPLIPMCRALLPGDDESMNDEAIKETLPHFWIAISMVFFVAATIFMLLKLSALGWWSIDEGSREEQAQIYHSGVDGQVSRDNQSIARETKHGFTSSKDLDSWLSRHNLIEGHSRARHFESPLVHMPRKLGKRSVVRGELL
ncbi:hypothetical protein Scep_022426 [Stephania cephalantha]|uniref:Uncharacterized protein n=1 Tax=Stephania cephalantha TaxID=152367 RepID=A0AAP0I0Y5_9MAGN